MRSECTESLIEDDLMTENGRVHWTQKFNSIIIQNLGSHCIMLDIILNY